MGLYALAKIAKVRGVTVEGILALNPGLDPLNLFAPFTGKGMREKKQQVAITALKRAVFCVNLGFQNFLK